MKEQDEWGRDPAVKAMRRLFRGVEVSQKRLFESLDIPYYDSRIRTWRERTLNMFEKAWAFSNQMGVPIDEENAPDIYIRCLFRIMRSDGIEISDQMLPKDEDIESLMSQFEEKYYPI